AADPAVGADVHPRHPLRPRGALPARRHRRRCRHRAAAPGEGPGQGAAGGRPGTTGCGAPPRGRRHGAPMSTSRTAHTLGRWTSDRARIAPGRVAVVDRGLELGYGELERRAAALAEAFERAGYHRGDRVATLTGTSADHVV